MIGENKREFSDILSSTGHRKTAPPGGPWAMTQRWNNLRFAHWPVNK
jgi:uncharacterized protein YqjF (DUF2071 family)